MDTKDEDGKLVGEVAKNISICPWKNGAPAQGLFKLHNMSGCMSLQS